MGTEGPDHLVGGSGNDVLCGLGRGRRPRRRQRQRLPRRWPREGHPARRHPATTPWSTGRTTTAAPARTHQAVDDADHDVDDPELPLRHRRFARQRHHGQRWRQRRTPPRPPPTSSPPDGRRAPCSPARRRPAPFPRGAGPGLAGAGTGYLLRDRHSSVTALVDATGAVTDTYAYGDYGTAASPSGQPPGPQPALDAGGRTNPSATPARRSSARCPTRRPACCCCRPAATTRSRAASPAATPPTSSTTTRPSRPTRHQLRPHRAPVPA